ncbi:GNAT family N-acetyltransferase [Roseomonas sp. E05]|uniref:GNAT family N-acetyltransferase n=1 Tax=Roseomonas sp. E05 TaxID=3046310 RepID=UPI0024BA2BAB|nr:GNAT family N-acetyltransferase [Roseomonas sp. E05]MDJ0388217.1 GNAT family N-acetyltransferase [Roseomonas sp. E05]
MICIRRAQPADATAIAAVHIACWRSTYPGLLPDAYLAGLSLPRIAGGYHRSLVERQNGEALFVAVLPPQQQEEEEVPRVVGFASCRRARRRGLAQGEIETLYVLDDWREQGLGRRLMRAAAAHLAAIGCGSVMLWVLTQNPSRWFYQRLGGQLVGMEVIHVGGRPVEQAAMLWNPIERLLTATARADGA